MANIVFDWYAGLRQKHRRRACLQSPSNGFCRYGYRFAATAGEKLQEIINQVGNDAFLKMEEDCMREGLAYIKTVATGGSVVYGKKAMRPLHENGLVVYIRLPYRKSSAVYPIWRHAA